MKISRTGRPSFAKLKRKVSNQLNFPYIHAFADAAKSFSLIKLEKKNEIGESFLFTLARYFGGLPEEDGKKYYTQSCYQQKCVNQCFRGFDRNSGILEISFILIGLEETSSSFKFSFFCLTSVYSKLLK